MKKLLFVLLIGCFTIRAEEQIHSLNCMGGLYYSILEEYTTTHTGCTAQELQNYMKNTAAFDIIINDASNSGYTKHAVINRCYAISLKQDPINTVIVIALRNTLCNYNREQQILTIGIISAAAFSTAINLFNIAFYILYFRRDRKIIVHYAMANPLIRFF